jgi:alkaline phosphatase D
MLGAAQKAWLVDSLANSGARWKLWGNEVQLQPLKIGLSTLQALLAGLADPLHLAPAVDRLRAALPSDVLYVNLDAWDGFDAERRELAEAFHDRGVTNLIALTGDFHTCLGGYLKRDYDRPNFDLDNRVGVEFMTPAITSANLKELMAAQIDNNLPLPELGVTVGELVGVLAATLVDSTTVKLLNNSIEFFDSAHWGYSVLEVAGERAVFSAYAVDKSRDEVTPRRLLVRFVADSGIPNLMRIDVPGLLADSAMTRDEFLSA